MRGGRILWGQIAVVFTIVLVMVWAATQWTAFRLGFQPQLGAPWFELAGLPVYYPPTFFWWWFSFDAYAPAIFVEGGIIAVSGGFLAIAAAILMSIIRAREARNVAMGRGQGNPRGWIARPGWCGARPTYARLSAP